MQTKKIAILRAMKNEMIRHAQEELPYEACGIIAGVTGEEAIRFYPTKNELQSETLYNIAPEDLYKILIDLEEKGLNIWGIFHSHPATPAYPSATDLKQSYYSDAFYLVVSFIDPGNPELRAFKIEGEEVEELEVEVKAESAIADNRESTVRKIFDKDSN